MFDEKSYFGAGKSQLNVLGGVLEPCSADPLTGFFRDGCCNWHPSDIGSHTVCAQMTNDFLEFSKEMDWVSPVLEKLPLGLAVADLNNDGKNDIVITTGNPGESRLEGIGAEGYMYVFERSGDTFVSRWVFYQ